MVEKVYIDKCSDDMCIPNKYHGLAVSVSVSHESASHVFLQDYISHSQFSRQRTTEQKHPDPAFSFTLASSSSVSSHTQVQVHTVLVPISYTYYTSIV